MKLLSLVLLILLGGCASAPLTDEQQYDRDNKEILRIEKFYRDERNCLDTNGVMVIRRWGITARQRVGHKLAPPRRWDTYGCMRGGLF